MSWSLVNAVVLSHIVNHIMYTPHNQLLLCLCVVPQYTPTYREPVVARPAGSLVLERAVPQLDHSHRVVQYESARDRDAPCPGRRPAGTTETAPLRSSPQSTSMSRGYYARPWGDDRRARTPDRDGPCLVGRSVGMGWVGGGAAETWGGHAPRRKWKSARVVVVEGMGSRPLGAVPAGEYPVAKDHRRRVGQKQPRSRLPMARETRCDATQHDAPACVRLTRTG